MLSADPDIRRLMALRAIEGGLLRLKWLAAATRFEIAMRRHDRALKAGFNPDQPRVPRGQPEGGQWTSDSGSGRGGRDIPTASDKPVRLADDITGFTRHGINQTISRSVLPSAILDAVVNPIQIIQQPNGTTRYVGAGAVVVLNPAGGVVTVWGR
jgi:hypothetical protein